VDTAQSAPFACLRHVSAPRNEFARALSFVVSDRIPYVASTHGPTGKHSVIDF